MLFSEPKIPQSRRKWNISAAVTLVSVLFSEPKIPQWRALSEDRRRNRGFSALQRAENSSIVPASRAVERDPKFQCSSASRKFLNLTSSAATGQSPSVSVLFSEPKIPQSSTTRGSANSASRFQCSSASRKFLNTSTKQQPPLVALCFSALQRAENSSMVRRSCASTPAWTFQCSSASRKFLNQTRVR